MAKNSGVCTTVAELVKKLLELPQDAETINQYGEETVFTYNAVEHYVEIV